MKRSAALAELSRDHHQALFVALRLRRATPDTGSAERARFLTFWEREGAEHFRREEEILLPAYAHYGSLEDPLVTQMLAEHATIRADAAALRENAAPATATLHAIGERLAAHVRFEERQLFPMLEAAIPPAALLELAQQLSHDPPAT